MTTPAQPEGITLEELKARAATLGVPISEDAWDQVHPMVSRALAAVRAFDAADLKSLEPSVIVRTVPAGG